MASSGAGGESARSATAVGALDRSEPGVRLQHLKDPLPLLFFSGADETSLDGSSKYNPRVASFIRDDWVAGQMSIR